MIGVAMLLLGGAAAHASAVSVVVTRGDTWDPAAGVDASTGRSFLSWTGYNAAGIPHAFLRSQPGSRVQLNQRGQGWAWGMDTAASTVAFQLARYGDSNVRFYDWVTAARSAAPPTVNSEKWEYEPSISGPWLVFARWNRVPSPDVRRLFLYNLNTGSETLLAEFAGGRADGMLESAQVNGDWVVWTTWRDRFTQARVTRYQISTGARDVVPAGRRPFDYLSSVSQDGTVYFLRSGAACGTNVRVLRYTTAGVVSLVTPLPAGRDGGDEMFAESMPGGGTDLYLDTFRCDAHRPNGNIWKVSVDAGATAPVRPATAGRPTAGVPKHLPAAAMRRLSAITGGLQ